MNSAGDASFDDLIRRVRAGDHDAFTKLVEEYGPRLRIYIRVALRSPRVRSQYNSEEVFQMVLFSFWRYRRRFHFRTAGKLIRFLITMARNKVAEVCKIIGAEKRDPDRVVHSPVDELDVADSSEDPSTAAESSELYDKVRSAVSPEEWEILVLRLAGCTWVETAANIGGQPDALRMRMRRVYESKLKELLPRRTVRK